MRKIILSSSLSLILFLTFAIPSIAQSEKQTYTRAYDLNFSMQPDSMRLYPWTENAAYIGHGIALGRKDSTRILFSKNYIKGSIPLTNKLRTEFTQRILLPNNRLKDGVVGFECKGKGLKRVSMLLEAIDEKERVLASETLTFLPERIVKSFSKRINLSDAASLNIRINASGEENKEAYIAFARLIVTLDNKPIDDYPVRILEPIKVGNSLDYIQKDKYKGFDLTQINETKGKKIIALGESMHGNSDINSFTLRLIGEAIEKQNCRLVLLEHNIEKSLYYNRYVQDESFVIDSSLVKELQEKEFLDKVRAYNRGKGNHEKVRVFGMDYPWSKTQHMSSSLYLFDFITDMNKTVRVPEVDRLAVLIVNERLTEAIAYLTQHRTKISKVLNNDELICLEHLLRLDLNEINTSEVDRMIRRDSVMALNARFLINKFASERDKMVFIYAHAGHVNPISTFPAVPCAPMGSYIKKEYGNDYCPLFITTEGGNASGVNKDWKRGKIRMNKAPKNSLEHYLNALTDCSIYFPLTPSFDRLTLTRYMGYWDVPHKFYPSNLYQKFNGVFFVKHDDQKNVLSHEILFEEGTKRTIEKTNRRKEILKEIESKLNANSPANRSRKVAHKKIFRRK